MRVSSESAAQPSEFGTENLIGHVTGPAVQAGAVHGGVHIHVEQAVSASSGAESRRHLPRRQALVGRQAELEQGIALLADRSRWAVVLVHGTPGVGKTAFAVELGWSVVDRFPDGCVYVEVAEHGDVVADLLSALAPGERLPGERNQRLAMLSALLAKLDVLVVLDNLRHEDSLADVLALDVRFALVCTSRARLTGLGDEDVSFLEICPLPLDDAARLAASVAERLTPEQSAQVAAVCGGLPIAVRVACARIQRSALLDVRNYLDDLADPDHGLDGLRAGGRSVERIIEHSHRALTSDQVTLFAVLGLLPNSVVTVDVVSVALAQDLGVLTPDDFRKTRNLLDDLHELNLVEHVAADTYRMHDVLYRFARHRAPDDKQWRDRTVGHACLAYAARVDLAIRSIGFIDEQATIPSSDNSTALAVLDQTHVGATSAFEAAIARELWTEAIALASPLIPALRHLGRWDGLVRVSTCLTTAGERTDNVEWRTTGLLNLGTAASHGGDTERAVDLYRQCFEVAADRPEMMAMARGAYGELLLSIGRSGDAIEVMRAGLRIWRWTGDDMLLALTLNGLGKANVGMARWERAERYFRNALRVAQRSRLVGLLPSFGVTLAEALRLSGRLDGAARECAEALNRARAVGHRKTEADALRQQALIQEAVDDTLSRADSLTAALEIYRELGDVRSQIATLHMMGRAAVRQGDREVAERHFTECIERARSVDDLAHWANALADLGSLHGETGDQTQAEDCFRRALAVAEDSGSEFLLMQVWHQQAQLFRRNGRVDRAVPLLRRNVALLERNGESNALASARARLGEALMHHGDWDEAAQMLRAVTEAPKETVTPRTRASAFRFLATLYSRRQLPDEASNAAEQALALAEESGSAEERMDCLLTSGNVLARTSRWEEAVARYQDALALATALRALHTETVIRSNLAACLFRTGATGDVITMLRRSLETAEKLGTKDLEASLRGNLGAALSEQNDLPAAVAELERALAIASALGNKSLAAEINTNLARTYITLDQLGEALRYVHDARLLWQAVKDWVRAAEALRTEAMVRGRLAVDAGEDLLQVPLPDDVAPLVFTALHAKRDRECYVVKSPEEEPLPDRRTIVVSQSTIDRLVDVDIDQVCARLATGRRHCVVCGLPLAEDGVAHLVLLSGPDGGPDGTTLAHPVCAPPSVVRVKQMPEYAQVRFEIECIVLHGDVAGVVVDARGPWGQREDGMLADVFLDSLRGAGFVDLGRQTGFKQLMKEKVRARLVGDQLTIVVEGAEIVTLPLSFYPVWYHAARKGRLVAMFGHDLRGMVADDARYLAVAVEEGNVVGAAVELSVVQPGRNRPCVCTPSSRLKYKHCCGKP